MTQQLLNVNPKEMKTDVQTITCIQIISSVDDSSNEKQPKAHLLANVFDSASGTLA